MSASSPAAIDALYSAFSSAPRPLRASACTARAPVRDVTPLLAKPLQALSPDELGPYAATALPSLEARGEFLYFLPRILEISATVPGWCPNPEVVGGAIRASEPATWSEAQRHALREFVEWVFTEVRTPEHNGAELNQWLCAIARMGFPLRHFLEEIRRSPRVLQKLYECHSEQLVNRRLTDGFWDEAPEAQQEVVEWFESPPTREAILRAYGL